MRRALCSASRSSRGIRSAVNSAASTPRRIDGVERHPAELVGDAGEQVVVELGVVGGRGDGCLDRARAAVGVLPVPGEAQHVARLEPRVEHERRRRRGRRREAPSRLVIVSERASAGKWRARNSGTSSAGTRTVRGLLEHGALGGRERRRERGELDRARVEVEAVEAVGGDRAHVFGAGADRRRRRASSSRRRAAIAERRTRRREHERGASPSPSPSTRASSPTDAASRTSTSGVASDPTSAMPRRSASASSAHSRGLSNSSSVIHSDP